MIACQPSCTEYAGLDSKAQKQNSNIKDPCEAGESIFTTCIQQLQTSWMKSHEMKIKHKRHTIFISWHAKQQTTCLVIWTVKAICTTSYANFGFQILLLWSLGFALKWTEVQNSRVYKAWKWERIPELRTGVPELQLRLAMRQAWRFLPVLGFFFDEKKYLNSK